MRRWGDIIGEGLRDGVYGILRYGMEWAWKVLVVVGAVTAGAVIVIDRIK
jgi:hypothetical protein